MQTVNCWPLVSTLSQYKYMTYCRRIHYNANGNINGFLIFNFHHCNLSHDLHFLLFLLREKTGHISSSRKEIFYKFLFWNGIWSISNKHSKYKTIYNENHTEQLDTNNRTLRYPVDFLLLTVTFSLACLSPEHNVQNSMYVCTVCMYAWLWETCWMHLVP